MPLRAVATTRNSPRSVHDVGEQAAEERAVVDHEHRRAAQRIWTPCATELTSTVPSPTEAAPCGRSRRRRPRRRAARRGAFSTCRAATTLRSPIWIVPGGAERREHAGAAGEPRRDPARAWRPLRHQLEQPRHGGLGELGRVAVLPAQRGRRQEDVRQSADLRLGVVQQDGDAAAEPHRDQRVVAGPASAGRRP